VNTRKSVEEPVRAGADRHAHADVEIAVIRVVERAAAAAVEDVEGIKPAADRAEHVLEAEAVVAPDDGAALLLGVVDAGSQSEIVIAAAGDARAKTNGLHETLDVQEHYMAVTFAVAAEVVPVLFAVIEENACRLEGGQVADRIAVRDVVGVVLVAFEIGDEHDAEAVGGGDLPEILVGVLRGQLHEVQVRIARNQALFLGAK